MKVILLEDVKSLGKKGQMVDVSDGYARNFIISKKKGIEATAKNMNDLKLQKAHEDKMAAQRLEEAKLFAAEIAKAEVVLELKVGEGGKLFGAVSSKEIAQAAKEQLNMDLDKKKLVLPNPIKTVGTTSVAVKLHPQVTAELKVIGKRSVMERRRQMEEALIKRVMPHDEEAESSVIGAMLIDNEAIMIASEIITGEDFYQKQMGMVYDTMVELYKRENRWNRSFFHTRLLEKGLRKKPAASNRF